ncbi:unnamed protein product [Boreogadus saida]
MLQVLQMGETRFSIVYLTLKSVQDIYPELREKLETHGEIARIENIAPDALSFLVTFLEPFYNAQRELEGDKYATINLVGLWFEKLKTHYQPSPTDSRQQAFVRQRHAEYLVQKIQVNMTLWPKFNKLRMMSPEDISEVHAHVRTLLLSVEEDAAALNDHQRGKGETQTLQSGRNRMITNQLPSWMKCPCTFHRGMPWMMTRIAVPKTSQAGKIRPLHFSKQQQQRAGFQHSWTPAP